MTKNCFNVSTNLNSGFLFQILSLQLCRKLEGYSHVMHCYCDINITGYDGNSTTECLLVVLLL